MIVWVWLMEVMKDEGGEQIEVKWRGRNRKSDDDSLGILMHEQRHSSSRPWELGHASNKSAWQIGYTETPLKSAIESFHHTIQQLQSTSITRFTRIQTWRDAQESERNIEESAAGLLIRRNIHYYMWPVEHLTLQ